LPSADPALRARIDARAAAEGWPALHAELARVDPATAARLKVTDAQRIQRALEVYELSGRPLSALQGARESSGVGDYAVFALLPADRAELHRRIAERFDAMLAAGLIDEVRTLRTRFALSAGMPSMRCVGYRQVWEFLEGDCDRATLRARGVAATRQLAKRQVTWLRSMDAEALEGNVVNVAQQIAMHVERAGTRDAAVQ
jgi:tRNA dimethylallyltransferase